MNTTPMKSDSNPAAASQGRPEPQTTEERKTGFFRSPRLQSWLMAGAGLCTRLSYIPMVMPNKYPEGLGE